MTNQNQDILFLLAISYTQNVHDVKYATELLKRDFPKGTIKYVNLDGIDVVMSEVYDNENNTITSSEFIIIRK